MTHGAVRFLIRALEAIVLVVLLAAALLAWRLSQGPLKLDVVAPYLASAFTGVAPGYSFRIEDAEFRWQGFSGAPELTVRDVRVLNEAGAVIAGLPTMQVRLSPAALKRGIAAPEQIRLADPIIRFVHRADGTLGLGVEGGPLAAPAVPGAAPVLPGETGNALAVSLIGALTRAPGGDNPAGYLDRVTIDGTTLVLVDEVSGRRWLVPDATVNFARAGADVVIDATLPVFEEGKRWNLIAKGRYTAADDNLKVDINVDGFRPARVAGLAPQLQPLAMLDLIMNGKASATLRLAGAGARLTGLTFDVHGQDGQLHLPEPVSQAYPVKSLALKGSAGADLDTVDIEAFRIELNRRGETTPVITMTGKGQGLGAAPTVDLDFKMDELSLTALKQYWPADIKPNTRTWIEENLSGGGITKAAFKLQLAGPSMAEIDVKEARLRAELAGISVRYMRGMPAVEGTEGVITIGPKEVVIDVTAGHVPDALSKKGLRIPTGRVRLHGLGGGPGSELADIDVQIVGDFGEVMRLVDNPPLGYAKLVGLDASRAEGDAEVELSLDFPLVKDLKLDQLAIRVTGKTDRISIPDVAFGLPLSAGRLAVSLDRSGMDVSGNAVVGGIPTAVAWRENFGGGEFRSRYVLDPVVGNEERPKIGLAIMPFIPPYIDGAVPARVVYTVNRDDTRHLEADVDLTGPAMAVPELGWRKEPGTAARGKVEARFVKTRLDAVPSFQVTSGEDLDVSGSVVFGEDGKMQKLVIKPSVVGDTRLSGELSIDEVGGYSIDVAGPTFNSTYFWRELSRDDKRKQSETGDAVFETPLKIRAAFDRAWLGKGGDFTNVTLDFVRGYTGIEAIDFASTIDGTTPFTFKLTSDATGRKFKGSSVAGGSVVRNIGLFDDIVGGKLNIDGEFAPDGTVRGVAEIKDFNVKDAPVLARLLSVATLTGILDELRGEGISFSTLRVPFAYGGGVLAVRNGEMYGNSVGLTGEGTYTFASSQMDFDGTLIPAYTFNAMLNRIPLLGPILTGGEKGGGIFAATYSYRGDIATAQPSVNPLAALAPGFLRHIFDIFKKPAPREIRVPDEDAGRADSSQAKVPEAAR